MCSTTATQIARICRAIEELADRAGQPDGPDATTTAVAEPDEPAAGDDVADRLAAIWAMIAEVDPGLARRLPGYLTSAD